MELFDAPMPVRSSKLFDAVWSLLAQSQGFFGSKSKPNINQAITIVNQPFFPAGANPPNVTIKIVKLHSQNSNSIF